MSFQRFLIWSSGGSQCLADQNHICNSGRGHNGEHSCKIILNFDQRETIVSGILTRLILVIGMCGDPVRSAMHAASQPPGKEPTDVDDAPASAP